MEIRLGAVCWNQYTDWQGLRDAGLRADRLGYHSLWTWDHLYPIVGSSSGPVVAATGGVISGLERFALPATRIVVPAIVNNTNIIAKRASGASASSKLEEGMANGFERGRILELLRATELRDGRRQAIRGVQQLVATERADHALSLRGELLDFFAEP